MATVFTEGSIPNRSWVEVPEERKKANGGTFEQAPADSPYAGEWFETGGISGIFGGGKKPWELAEQQAAGGGFKTKPGFESVFGPHPVANDFATGTGYRVARTSYRQAHSLFISLGDPPFGTDEERTAAHEFYEAFGMREPIYFQSVDGWWARWRNPNVTDEDHQGFYTVPEGVDLTVFQMAADTAIRFPHLVIANYQVYATIKSREIDGPGVMVGDVASRVHPLLTGVSV